MTTPPSPQAKVVSADDMRARLAALSAVPGPEPVPEEVVSDDRRRLRERVVLLDYFTVDGLETAAHRAGLPDKAIDEFIAKDCEFVTTRSGGGWRLRLDIRRDTLDDLGVDGALGTTTGRAAVTAGADDITHTMAVRLLRQEDDIRGLSPTELAGILKALDWLEGSAASLPDRATVQAALDLANVLAPLRAVATPDFVGREAELALLEEHLRGPKRGSRPLALHGPGGVGKSTLLAKFVLDHVERRDEPLPFAYLTFDRAELDPDFPISLVAEVCRQLALQSADLAEPLGNLRRDIASVVEAEANLLNESSSARGRSVKDSVRRYLDENRFLIELSARLRDTWGDRPVLIVLDTFEVAQRRRGSSLSRLDRTLGSLRAQLPSLRTVIAGRAEVTELNVDNRPLEGLDRAQSIQLLQKAVGVLPVTDALISDVVDQVGGNPLSLRLAADLMRQEGSRVLATRRGRRRLLRGLRAEQVQGVLYRRILDHVAPAIRPLANPGLVVRKITRDVIREVLAEPCGLGKITTSQADDLYDQLRGEVSLVSEPRAGMLVHRPDVRQEMLPLLEAEDHDRVERIHRAAIAFYVSRPSTDDRIEELYHRLMLGQATSTLDEHWDRAAGPFLETTMPELPASSRVYLAGKLDLEVDPVDLEAADYTAWARQATKQARALLDSGRPGAAWDLLEANDRQPRLIEVSRLRMEALATLGRRTEARAEAEAAITAAQDEPLSLDFIDLCIVGARIAEDSDDFARGLELFLEARDSAMDYGAHELALTAGVGVLRMVRRDERLGSMAPVRRIRGELITEVAKLTQHDKAANPGLVRELAAELGDSVPSLLVDASEHVGITSAGDDASGHDAETLDVLQESIRKTIADAPPGINQPRAVEPPPEPPVVTRHADPSVVRPPSADQAYDVSEWSSTTQGHAVAEAVKSAPWNQRLRESLTKYWRREADRKSYDFNTEDDRE